MEKLFKPVLLFVFILSPLWGIAQYSEYEWKERDSWMDVAGIMELAGIEKGTAVADIGCHEGYLSIHLARKVGESGKVYAVDVRQDRLDKLKENLKERNLKNVKVILGDYDNPKLKENSLDAVVIMDTYHEMRDYMEILKHVKKALKPDGRILILEKFKHYTRNKSREHQTDAHTLASKYVKKELEDSGFKITKEVKDFGKWNNESDKTIWILVGVKA
ncbi:methyltransferase domain-containing protein [Leptobacterium flavescens]|uniref:Methyltransferase domain-containing protein n=1 Tax=Leptobacterium flavescens TaxID=472055 RepID=A0A6P0UT81_9FLAO|nr:class I SAM-dependent methyltransferase [Leptobacterium flavescens]NER13606.1 methyltransferase domain-containing protein [Leptobacterium flavescens]